MNYYNEYKKLSEIEKNKYIITSSSSDDYPHLYTPSSSSSRHFSTKIEEKMDANKRKDICRYAIFLTKGKCAYCGKQLVNLKNGKKIDKLNWDHIRPASKCNILIYGNILLSCSDCNISKSDSYALTWYKNQLNSGSIRKGLFSYEEMEALLKDEFELYKKHYHWASIVNDDYFYKKENENEANSTLIIIHDQLNVYGLLPSSSSNNSLKIKCSSKLVKEINALIENVPEAEQTENFVQAMTYFLNNFGYVEVFLKKELVTSLLDYNNFVFGFELFLSIVTATTFNKIKDFANKIVKYYFKKDFSFDTYSKQTLYLKKL